MQLVSSLNWRLGHDTSFMHYVAYLINEHGFLPYRDIFEVNMPGTYLFHMTIGKLFGYSDLAFRIVDIIWTITTLTVTWLIMKPFGNMTAIASCLLFGNIYLASGASMSLQRDVIAILPIATAFLISTRNGQWRSEKLTYWLIGALFGLASLVKPHMAIGLPAAIVYSIICNNFDSKLSKKKIKHFIVCVFFALIGFLSIFSAPFLWMWHIGALQSFWEIFSSFTPLYSQLSSNVELMEAFRRFKYAVRLYLSFGSSRALMVGALLGALYVWTEKSSTETRKLTTALFSFTVLYTVYVAIGGKFWKYHWMPYIYFSSLCTALMLFPWRLCNYQRSLKSLFSLFTFVLISVLVVQPSNIAINQLSRDKNISPFIERVDEMTTYLNNHLSPNDTVQPLDWSGGTLYAMLRSQAVVSTPFLTDFQFYLHTSTPYIQKLRENFITRMNENKPTFILDVHTKSKVKGIDASYHFPELDQFIQKYYRKDYESNEVDIFQKLDNV